MKKAYIIRLTIVAIVGLLSVLGVFGLYPVKIMDLQFIPLIERLFNDFAFVVLFTVFLFFALCAVFGRIYCSTLCPFGIMQEGFDILYKKLARKKKKNKPQNNYKIKYVIAFIVFSVLLGGSTVIIKYIDPYTIFSNAFSLSLFGIIFSAGVLVLVFFKNRFFCTNICPVGAILGLISKYSVLKIHLDKNDCVACGVCARSCPSGCIDIKEGKIDNEICIKCFKCVRVCPQNSINYSYKKSENKKKIKFNPQRREAIIGAGAFLTFSALCSIGVAFSKNMAKKIKNIILPPGADSARRMANKCLNCNLCINNCPTKILAKANVDFGAVHIDYSKGKGYCEYNCNNCSKACPSGAIKKISLEEKQQTRIAMALINKEKCKNCGLCAIDCPVGAIKKEPEGSYAVDGFLCIGCGKCAQSCEHSAITINPINKQSKL